jgi:enediyne biosynthesis protein E4
MPVSFPGGVSRRGLLRFLGRGGAVVSLDLLSRSVLDRQGGPTLETMFGQRLAAAQSEPASPAGSTFLDVTRQAGLGAARNTFGHPREKRFLLEEMGCGAAFFDYDNDGWLDIFLVNGTSFDAISSNTEPTSYLFHNNRDGTFSDVTREARLAHAGWGQGCCIGDYDNDGFDDLFVTYWGRNVLYHNNGDGTFTDVSETAGVAGDAGRWGAGCCFLDYDRDGRLDLFVANYVRFDPGQTPGPGESPLCKYNNIAIPCGPQGFGGGTNILYRNRGDGTFEDVSEKSGIANPRAAAGPVYSDQNWRPVGSFGMGAAAADFDNDGWPDIYVACDTAPSLLYHNNHDGTFSEVGVAAGCAFNEDGVAMAGMGVAVGDYDGDGWFDIVRTNFSDQITTIYRNLGDGTFYDAALQAGAGVNTKYLGFGVGFLDFDNDGWQDIFIANGHVYPQIEGRKLHVSYAQRKIVYRNLRNGRFAEVSQKAGAAILEPQVSRGCAFGDFDNDGNVDVLVNNLDGAPSLLRNEGGSRNNWLILKCSGTRSNRSAIGTRVRVVAGERSQIAEVMSGSSYYSQNDLRLHFGLGQAKRVDRIEVRWPAGGQETFSDIAVDQILHIREGEGIDAKKLP